MPVNEGTAARPERTPGLYEAVEASVSVRVAKRVKENPTLADSWTWVGGQTTRGQTTEVHNEDVIVRLTGSVLTHGDLDCSCLMAPKCLHVLAVVAVLRDHTAPRAPPTMDPGPLQPAPSPDMRKPPADTAHAQAALGSLLALGAHGSDAVVRAGLSRVAYEARSGGLHRLARAVSRVVHALRLLSAGHPSFQLAALVADTTEALTVAHRLSQLGAGPSVDLGELIGEARRAYSAVGNLRLWGLCSEPVLSGTGQAGVVTWLVDTRARCWNGT